MRRTPLKRSGWLPKKAAKPKGGHARIRTKPKADLSKIDCCPEAEARAAALVDMGCWCCGKPAQIHHLRKGTAKDRRAPWWRTIPLCPEHHTDGGPRVAVHAGTRIWAWQEEAVLEAVNQRLPEFMHGPAPGE